MWKFSEFLNFEVLVYGIPEWASFGAVFGAFLGFFGLFSELFSGLFSRLFSGLFSVLQYLMLLFLNFGLIWFISNYMYSEQDL